MLVVRGLEVLPMERKLITDCTRNGESFSSCSLHDLEILKCVDAISCHTLESLKLDHNAAVRDFAKAVIKARRD